MNNFYITRQGLEEMARLDLTAASAARDGMSFDDFFEKRKPMSINDENQAEIHVFGPMVNSAPNIYEQVGYTFYQSVSAEIDEALEKGAEEIILNINSPGGSVIGLPELAYKIENLPVPVHAVCADYACSAAYYLAVSCTTITATQSCIMPNIGTIMTYMDYSEMLAKVGVTIHAVVNDGATLKSTFHLASITDEQREFLQKEVDSLGGQFQKHVLSNRPEFNSDYFDARWTRGEVLVDDGVIDFLIK